MKHIFKSILLVGYTCTILAAEQLQEPHEILLQSISDTPSVNQNADTSQPQSISNPACTTDQDAILDHNPLLTVVLMVKNEEKVVVDTLRPYVEAGIDSFYIFDTGSTDKTVEMVQAYFKDSNVRYGFIGQEPFINFAASRNRALELAEAKFPKAQYFLMPDAEWYMKDTEKLISFLKNEALKPEAEKHPLYSVTMLSADSDFQQPRLFRAHVGVRFVGKVHEVPNRGTFAKVPRPTHFWLNPGREGMSKSAARWHRDREILQKEFDEHPEDPRNSFYLAQTYACLGDLDNAIKYYEIRSNIHGWDEENFMTVYRLAQAHEWKEKDNLDAAWPKILSLYLKAYAIRPSRAEPLIKIAQRYLSQDNHYLSYIFAHQAAKIPYPENDVLFIEKEAYEFTRWDILGRCAWWSKNFKPGKKAIETALKKYPHMPHLYRNLAAYVESMNNLAKR